MSGSSNSSFTPCPEPFLAERDFIGNGGYELGRWCNPITIDGEDVSCCFPCPITDWRYSDEYHPEMVPWIGLFVLIMMLISLLTYAVLPVSATQRHYLTTAPLLGFVFMTAAWIIPLGPSVHYCYDAITPNNWLSDTTCAFSGSLLLYGVWVVVSGCFFRALSLYLQLCWEHEPGPRFRNLSLAAIFLGSLGMLLIVLFVSGVSYQVGSVCYVSYPRSQGSFWGPLISLAGVSFLLQLLIIIYCIRGVMTNTRFSSIFKRPATPEAFSSRSTARQISRRLWHILQLQWRPMSIVLLILFHVVFVAQAVLRWGDSRKYPVELLKPWIECLVEFGERDKCLPFADALEPSQGMVVGALALLASCGFWGFLCTVRRSMVIAWFTWLSEQRDRIFKRGRKEAGSGSGDIERIPSSIRMSDPCSPSTLEEVDRVYGTRVYHAPKDSFSTPSRKGTITTTITSNSAPSDVTSPTYVPSTIGSRSTRVPSIGSGRVVSGMTSSTYTYRDSLQPK